MSDAERERLTLLQYDAGEHARMYATRVRASLRMNDDDRQAEVAAGLSNVIEWVKAQGGGQRSLHAAFLLATELADVASSVDAAWVAHLTNAVGTTKAREVADDVWSTGLTAQTAVHEHRRGG